MPGVFIGSTELTTVGDIKIGGTDVQEVYVGATKVFPTAAALTPILDWNPELAETVPGTSAYARASISQISGTSDGTTFWYQETKSGELSLKNNRRVANRVTADVSAWNPIIAGAGVAPIITDNFANGVGGASLTATRVQLEAGGATSGDQSALAVPDNNPGGVFNGTNAIWMRLNTETSRSVDIVSASSTVTVTVTDSWQRFSTSWVSATFRTILQARGDNSGPSQIDLLVDDGADFGPQIEIVQNSGDAPGEFVNRSTIYNGAIAGVRYFNTTNANTVVSDVVVETPGSLISGGAFLREPISTNRMLHSNDLIDSSWVKNGAAGVSDLFLTDIGRRSSQLTDIGALGVDDVVQTASGFTASGPIAPSFLLRRVSATGTARIVQATDGASGGDWDIDLSAIGTGWVVIKPGSPFVTENTAWTASAGGAAGIAFAASAGGPLSFDVAFVGQEDREFATSPIVTTTSIQTRQAVSLTDVDWPVQASAVLDVTVDAAIVLPALGMTMLGFGSGAGRIFAVDAPSVLRLFNAGINSFTVAGTSYEGERHSFGMSIRTNEGIVVDDESNNNTDPTGTPGQGTIYIGSDSVLDGQPCEVHRVRIYDQTQTISELEGLF